MSENKKKLSQYAETTLDEFQASANTFIPGFQSDTCNCKINRNEFAGVNDLNNKIVLHYEPTMHNPVSANVNMYIDDTTDPANVIYLRDENNNVLSSFHGTVYSGWMVPATVNENEDPNGVNGSYYRWRGNIPKWYHGCPKTKHNISGDQVFYTSADNQYKKSDNTTYSGFIVNNIQNGCINYVYLSDDITPSFTGCRVCRIMPPEIDVYNDVYDFSIKFILPQGCDNFYFGEMEFSDKDCNYYAYPKIHKEYNFGTTYKDLFVTSGNNDMQNKYEANARPAGITATQTKFDTNNNTTAFYPIIVTGKYVNDGVSATAPVVTSASLTTVDISYTNITINDAMGIGCIIKVFDEVWDIDTYNRNYRQ